MKLPILDDTFTKKIKVLSVPTPPSGYATVLGNVTDPAGNPISGAIITLDGYEATTDENGYYEIKNVKCGKKYKITATAEGYQPFEGELDLKESGVYRVDITLYKVGEKKPIPWKELAIIGAVAAIGAAGGVLAATRKTK